MKFWILRLCFNTLKNLNEIASIIFLILPLYSVELISYNIYDRNDRVDLMLSFDNAYNGKISQKKEKKFNSFNF